MNPAVPPLNSALPLYMLLAADILNGSVALASGAPATAAALGIKALIAACVFGRVPWTALLAGMAAGVAGCLVLHFGFSPLARLPSSADTHLLMLKTGAVIVLMALLASWLQQAPEALVATYLRVALLVIAASLGLGLAGIGHDRYGDEEAFLSANGFLPAGNEINIALIALLWWLADRRERRRAGRLDRALFWLCLGLMLASGSKTTLAGLLVTLAYVYRRRWAVLLGAAAALPLLLAALVATGAWERWTFFFARFAHEGALSGLTGGRFGRAADLLQNWHTLPDFGLAFMALHGYVESDPADLVLNAGWPGAALFLLFGACLWFCCGRKLVPWLLVMATSVFAGHVVYSVFAAPILVMAFGLAARRTPLDSVHAYAPHSRLAGAQPR